MLALILLAALNQAPEAKPKPKPTPEPAASTPEEALKSFFVAMVAKDEAALRSVTLPNDEMQILLGGKPAPPLASLLVKAQLSKQKIRALKPGEEVTLPGNRILVVKPEDVTEERAFLLFDGPPMGGGVPLRLHKQEDRWRVDASPIIAGRKAAAKKQAEIEAREKEASGR